MESKVYTVPKGENVNFYNMFQKNSNLVKYIKENFPQIKRGDTIDININQFDLSSDLDYRSMYVFWDGKKVLPQCTDFYEYGGGGPPLCFKTITEFPINYFEGFCIWSPIYLDYDTFHKQILDIDIKSEEDEEWDKFFVTYNGKKYEFDFDDSEDYSPKEYLEYIKSGFSIHNILVSSKDKIVDIDGVEVY